MSLPQMLMVFIVAVAVASYISSKKLDKQLFITMWTVVGTKEEFLVNRQSRYFFYGNLKYDIIPSCCRTMRWKRGIHSFIPTTVQTAEYTWSDKIPVNPDTGLVYVISPEAYGVMDSEALVSSMNRATKREVGKKETVFQKYQLFIIIGVVLVFGVFIFMKMKGLDESITILAQYYKSLTGGK